MADTLNDQEFIKYVVKALVSKPEAVKVERKVDEMGVLLELSVDPEDMGRVIGKQGQTAKALRTLLRLIGVQNKSRINLKIVEPEGGERRVVKEEKVEEETEEKVEKKAEEETEKKLEENGEEEKATEIV